MRGIAPVGNVSGERVSDFAPAIGKRQQHHATVAGQAASIKRGCDFLARNGWQIEAELAIVGHGCGSAARPHRVVSTPIPYASSMPCATPVSSNRNPAE
jgi:hypothetical protein